MSAKLDEIQGMLNSMGTGWKWQFSSAPRPGEARVKLTAVKYSEPDRTKSITLSSTVVDELPPLRIAQNLVRLLPTLPEKRTSRLAPVVPANMTNARADYDRLRKLYRSHVQDLKEAAREGEPVRPLPHHAPLEESSLSRFFGQFAKKFVVIAI